MRTYEEKKKALYDFMNTCIEEDICIAFSGGVDSSVFVTAASQKLCRKKKRQSSIYAVTFHTMLHPSCDFGDCTESGKRSGSYT